MNTFRPHNLANRAVWLGLLLGITSASQSVIADDIEIYLTEPPEPVPPNVLFLLDESGSMRSGDPSRRDELVQAMKDLINDPDMGNVNAALLGWTTNTDNNGPLWMVAHSGDFQIIEDNRSTLISAVDGLTAISNRWTPTVKTLEAAVNWFRRDQTFTDATGFVTTSPIAGTPQDNWCRPNHMVLLTDGLPNSNSTTSGQAYGLRQYPPGTACVSDSTSRWSNGVCAREIAAWAYNTDLETGSGWTGNQNIITHTIGFDTDSDSNARAFLRSISDAGHGRYYPASNSADLVAAFTDIVTEAQETIPYAYTAPVIPFDQDNAAVSGNRIYVPMLVPGNETFWKGNLKKYTIRTTTSSDGVVTVSIEDANGHDVINDSYEFVDSQDHWADQNDEADPLAGGAASNMNASGSRNLYSNLNEDLAVALSDSTNRVHDDNTDNITIDTLNVSTEALRTEILNWVSWTDGGSGSVSATPPATAVPCAGEHAVCYLPDDVTATVWYGANDSWVYSENVTGSINCSNSVFGDPIVGVVKACFYLEPASSHENEMGAPLHTKPSIVSYSGGDVVYLPTSEGVLEAFDAETGEELWAFMPKDLLDDIVTIKNNEESSIPHYGLDGPLTIYEADGHTMAIFGMRRGGFSYYILDITDRLHPLFVKQISPADEDFSNLGQTWSKPILANMVVSGSTTDVLIFGGGYDPDQDDATSRADDDQGASIYIIDASDGSLINQISNATSGISGLNNSIPSDVLPFDMNRNGVIDRIYAADVGGRIIRIDVPEDNSTSLTGGIIADINAIAGSPYRRFFNTPEVGYYNRGGVQYLAVLIGSGDKTSPLDQTLTDRFYMFKDKNVWAAPTTYATLDESDLYDATDNLLQDGTDAQQQDAQIDLAENDGWYIDLENAGEKTFSGAVLYNYAVMFTTYSAERSEDLGACEARSSTGTARFYTINMTNGAAMFAGLGGDDTTLNSHDRSKVLSMAGLPPKPNLLFPENQTAHTGGGNVLGDLVTAIVGLENVNDWPLQLIPVWWEEVIDD